MSSLLATSRTKGWSRPPFGIRRLRTEVLKLSSFILFFGGCRHPWPSDCQLGQGFRWRPLFFILEKKRRATPSMESKKQQNTKNLTHPYILCLVQLFSKESKSILKESKPALKESKSTFKESKPVLKESKSIPKESKPTLKESKPDLPPLE